MLIHQQELIINLLIQTFKTARNSRAYFQYTSWTWKYTDHLFKPGLQLNID